jgi:hypothetical protein
MRGFRGLPLFLLAACAAPADRDERVAADRKDVTHALYRQLDEVLAQRNALAKEPGEDAARTRDELDALAQQIAEHIVRLDPEADVDALVQRLKEQP